MSYPERRPYATTVNHSGYCAKPQPLAPKPPTDALRILSSQIGYDQPRGSRPRAGTAGVAGSGGRLPALAPSEAACSDMDAQRALAGPTLFPSADRRSQEALAAAKLQEPFQHAASTYHSSQQGILNAELRFRVEKFLEDWKVKVGQLNELVGHYPTDGATVNLSATEAIKSYLDAYRCTEDLSVPVQKLIDDRSLNTSLVELDEIESVPVVPLDNIRRSLDSLLTSPYLLGPLDQYLNALRVYDSIAAGLPEEMRIGRSEDGAEPGLVSPAATAVVLHEKLHYDPGAYAMSELKKTEEPLMQMEARVADSRGKKEAAIDAMNPVDALRSLHAQVDFSNDMLLLNKARMDLLELHGDDLRELRAAVASVIEDARQAAEMLEARVRAVQPRLTQDIETLAGDMVQSYTNIEALEAREVEAEKAMRQAMRERDDEEKELWDQMRTVMRKLMECADAKVKLAGQHMSMRERRAREHLAAKELLKAQAAHHERLTQCEELVVRWSQGSDVYGKFVDAFVPKLLKRINELEDGEEDLKHREAQDYARRFEMFAYAAEEARAKRSVQADRMRLMQRCLLLDQAAASDTLDPKSDDHAKRYEEAGKELEEATAYVAYIRDIEEDRRAEVEPVLHRVLAYNLASQRASVAGPEVAAIQDRPTAGALTDGPSAPQGAGADHHDDAAVRGALADGTAAEVLDPAPLPATVAHPYVTASKIAIAHEEAYVEKHRELNNKELAAQEEKIGGIRRTKAQLAAMAEKYNNADGIRDLLLGGEKAAADRDEL